MPTDDLDRTFRPRTVAWVAGLAVVSFAVGLGFTLFRPASTVSSSGADVFSASALGYKAFVDLLRGHGVPVVVSRSNSGTRAAGSALLVVAEPRVEADPLRAAKLRQMAAQAGTLLLVLPKWTAVEDPQRSGWVRDARLLPRRVPMAVLQAAGASAAVVRRSGEDAPVCDGLEASPRLLRPQLLRPAEGLVSLVSCPGGVLLAEVIREKKGRLLVLSDPDLLSNHGLAREPNARLAWQVLERARGGAERVVIFDETLHGHERPASLWAELLQMPLLPATVQAGLVIGVLVWSGLGRFGAPVPREPALAAGHRVLIDNTAALLRLGGHSGYTLRRYLEGALHDVTQALHAPEKSPEDLRAWLRQLGGIRGVSQDIVALEARVDEIRSRPRPSAAAAVAAARRIHHWKEEMLRGPQGHRPR
jgi:hypothetical protein